MMISRHSAHWEHASLRPPEPQFVMSEKKALHRADTIHRDVRRWYARDGGESTLRQLLDVMAAG